MNTQNITALTEQLKVLGFGNLGFLLLQRICFKPERFSMLQKIERGKDQVTFQLFFEKVAKQNAYILMYYDAILQKATVLPDATVNGINTTALEKQMADIDWAKVFELNEGRQWSVEDKLSWEKEQKIEAMVEDLATLEEVEEGKLAAMNLKLKYWADVPHQELVGNINPSKGRSEISQRFYFLDGQEGISVDEAYRFLQNRWLEKQLQVKKKEADDASGEDMQNDSYTTSDGGLLPKKRPNKRKRKNN